MQNLSNLPSREELVKIFSEHNEVIDTLMVIFREIMMDGVNINAHKGNGFFDNSFLGKVQHFVKVYESSISKEDALQNFHADAVDFLNTYQDDQKYKELEENFKQSISKSPMKAVIDTMKVEDVVKKHVVTSSYAMTLLAEWSQSVVPKGVDLKDHIKNQTFNESAYSVMKGLVTAYPIVRLIKNIDDEILIEVAKIKQSKIKPVNLDESIFY